MGMDNKHVLKCLRDGKQSLRELVTLKEGILWNRFDVKEDRFGNIATMFEILEHEFQTRVEESRQQQDKATKPSKKGGQ